MIETKPSIRAFLCHASNDKPAVQKLYEFLVNNGVDAWLDREKLVPGHTWQIEIQKAVKSSDVIILCVSAFSVNKEGFVQREIKMALDAADEKPEGTIFVIPARLENCEIPERIKHLQYVDLFSENGYTQLLKSIQMRAAQLENLSVQKRESELSLEHHYSVGVFGQRKLTHQNLEKDSFRAFVWSRGVFSFRMIATYQKQDTVRDLLSAVFRRNNKLYQHVYKSESQGWVNIIEAFLEDDDGNHISLGFNEKIPKNIWAYSEKDISWFHSGKKSEIHQPDQPVDIRIYIGVYFPGT